MSRHLGDSAARRHEPTPAREPSAAKAATSYLSIRWASGECQPLAIGVREGVRLLGSVVIIYHFMYGKRQTSRCPMCTMGQGVGMMAAAAGAKTAITDLVKAGHRVSVTYHEMGGMLHAAAVRVIAPQ